MRRVLQRFPSLLARNFLQSPATSRHSKIQNRVVPLLNRSTSRFVFFSSQSDPASNLNSEEVVSKEELKKRIQSFLDDGDEDALPDLFEAMMIRKLSGKHDESDDEVMEVVRKYPVNKFDDIDSDIDSDGGLSDSDSSDSDIDNDGLRDGDSSDSDIDSSNDLSGCDSSDSDIEFDGLKDIDLSVHNIKIDARKANPSSDYDSESD
ncbi:hypothetical protein V5N11_025329 [Cardamine amara subsp. amara]|uniref:Uncharacterized protein n=1 Tax=Cardamine amara subsp. amara TaxID=228776 RepID=A0ABD1BI64_CARAN